MQVKKNIKFIVLLINKDSLLDDSSITLRSTAIQIGKYFSSVRTENLNIDNLKKSVCVVINKCCNEEDIHRTGQGFLESVEVMLKNIAKAIQQGKLDSNMQYQKIFLSLLFKASIDSIIKKLLDPSSIQFPVDLFRSDYIFAPLLDTDLSFKETKEDLESIFSKSPGIDKKYWSDCSSLNVLGRYCYQKAIQNENASRGI